MKRKSIHQLLLTATALGSVFASTACQQASPVARMQTAAAPAPAQPASGAPMFIEQAREALARRDSAAAVSFAELAVRAEPSNVEARSVLALAYMKAGRFRAANEAYSDLIQMGADDNARLRRVLALLAAGDRTSALSELYSLRDPQIASDVGLAYALAGETKRGLDMMTEAARAVDATPRARQNLALGYALSGQWAQARAEAALDLDAAKVERRMSEWATFAANSDMAWKVSRLLDVTPAQGDSGRPEALAYTPPAEVNPEAAPVEQAVADVPPSPTESAASPAPVQTVAIAADPSPMAAAPVAAPAEKRLPGTSVNGTWVVQLGAYASDDILKANWRQATRRNPALLEGKTLIQTEVRMAGRPRLVRLAVGKFETRADANELCRALREHGSDCFVRPDTGSARG